MRDHGRRFLLKVWRESNGGDGERGWRAALRDVVDGSLREFSTKVELVAYLTEIDEGTSLEHEVHVVRTDVEVDG
ncbi:MAG: hypothetical protein KF875_00870 [Trueperaceae bacterium]|nr:hypothetical protein [Trueperaceae bacterium]MCC6310686.1 hypothetical protein [Trueperaceae bacterium]MCO5172665.1 hypothetical protein [Trueperaceae bacterium]MCW5819521.1 hypothetical protein [Trueperaceae bacterium]